MKPDRLIEQSFLERQAMYRPAVGELRTEDAKLRDKSQLREADTNPRSYRNSVGNYRT